MPVSLQDILGDESLGLSLVVPGDKSEALLQEISWVHNSDLLDPTPWLEPGQLLLTDGQQFVGELPPNDYDKYVERLLAQDVNGLGFSTEVLHQEIPSALIQACTKAGLPLVKVPGSTPFVAISRFVAKVISDDQRSQLEWSLNAQKALARAALRPDGLPAVLKELERQLQAWVVLYDANGKELRFNSERKMPDTVRDSVADAITKVLGKGIRSAQTLSSDSGDIILQTLGHNDQLRGVLAVGPANPLDDAATEVVTSVIAIASIALEQSRQLNNARMNLRNGLLELMLTGSSEIAISTSIKIWGGFPQGTLRAISTSSTQPPKQLEDELELIADESQGSVFFAKRPTGQLLLLATDRSYKQFVEKLSNRGLLVGISSAALINDVQPLVDQAMSAAGFTSGERLVVHFEEIFGDGLLAYLNNEGGKVLATKRLAPVMNSQDAPELLNTLSVWLEANCAWEPAAKLLHVHRHTLRNRIKTIEDLLKVDFSLPTDRFEVWSALQLAK